MVIFDCNGVLVDSEPIAAAVLADAFKRIGVAISADTVTRRFQGRRPSDIFAAVEAATNSRIPPSFPGEVAAETLLGYAGRKPWRRHPRRSAFA